MNSSSNVSDDISDTSDRPNWRIKLKPKTFQKNAANQNLKFCPGISCCKYLPIDQFGINSNMVDSRDIYCLKCNRRKKLNNKKYAVQTSFNMKNHTMDKYELFKMKQSGDIFS